MLPTPRLSARISSRRAASGDTSTSRIARRVPSPLLPVAVATPQQHNGSTAQARGVPHPAANNSSHLSPPTTKLTSNTRPHAGSQSRSGTPGLLGRTSCPVSEQSEAASRSLISVPRPEAKKAGAPHQAPSLLAGSSAVSPKDEQRLKAQEGRAVFAQHQEPETRNPATTTTAASVRLQHRTARRPASTAFASGFSRIENTSSGDGPGAGAGAGALPSIARKKPSFTVSVSGKENRQPQLRARVPAPPVTPLGVLALPSVPPTHTTRRTVAVVAQPSRVSFHGSPPRPLVVKKRTLHAPAAGPPRGDSKIRSAAAGTGAPFGLPAGIKTLMDDINCFAKEWSEMFDELSTGVDGPEGRPSKLDSFTRIRPIVELESTGTCQADGPCDGKNGCTYFLLAAPSGSAGSINTLRVSPLVSTDGEMIHVDVKLVTLARWQHGENATVKNASVDDESVSNP